ncbi:MAG: gamma-glutamylcyclotransferase [Alphaproteobacteria bacterium]|nr:gamma-glutamylcyclotransferase [Alphaproteobacteria bacterium]
MWNPGFDYESAVPAQLDGYHRAFCVYSVFYRGTAARPGLVLGLDRGGVCHGLALQVPAERARATIQYLRSREQVTGVYRETLLPISVRGPHSTQLMALTFVCERNHPGFAGQLPITHQAHLIRSARGRAGSNLDYTLSTIRHLKSMQCREPGLDRLVSFLGPVFANGASSSHASCKTSGHALARQLQASPLVAPKVRPDVRKRYLYRNHLAAQFEGRWPANM